MNMKKIFIIITTLFFFIVLTFNASRSYAFSTSYVYVYAQNRDSGKTVKKFDVHVYESHYRNPNRLLRATEARGAYASFTLRVGKVYFVLVKKHFRDGSFLEGGKSFRVYDKWSNKVTVRLQYYR